jgi:hypothetical protein
VKIETCPRCGVKRPDAFQWCRKCGLDFEKAERGQFPPGMPDRPVSPYAPPPGWTPNAPPVPHEPQWQQPAPRVDVRPVNDRQNMARWTANALDVRCGATAGGCLGMILGLIVAGSIGAVIGGVAPLLLAPVGVFVGLFIGMRLALSLMARG